VIVGRTDVYQSPLTIVAQCRRQTDVIQSNLIALSRGLWGGGQTGFQSVQTALSGSVLCGGGQTESVPMLMSGHQTGF
jgi:hypothetical protein